MCMQPPAKQQNNGFGTWKTLTDINQLLTVLESTFVGIQLLTKENTY